MLYTTPGWATERVIEKTEGTTIVALTDYESEDVVRITGGQLVEEDWAELRKMFSVGFHLILDNGQEKIPAGALSIGMIASAVISISGPNIVSIGNDAFLNNRFLTSFDFPYLKSIGEMAFFGCSSLTEITLPRSLESIDDGAFAMCQGLVSINVAEGNERFKSLDGVLYSADGGTLFAYPAGKTRREFASDARNIRRFAFYGAQNLERVVFSSVVSIGNGAFVSCVRLADVVLPEGLRSIGQGVFDSCLRLTEIELPASLEWIGDGAFSYCNSLRSISVARGSEFFKSLDGVLYSADGNTLFAYPAGRDNFNYSSNAKEIRPYAFMYARRLRTLTLPHATSIGEGAFAWCEFLTAISIPSAGALGNGAFARCVSLNFMELGNSVPAIQARTFTSNRTLLVVTSEPVENIDLEGWPSGTGIASLRGTATLGPVILRKGDRLTLSMDIEGAADYRWAKDRMPISGANESFLDRPEVSLEDSGIYDVMFSFDMGSGPVGIVVEGIEVIILPCNGT